MYCPHQQPKTVTPTVLMLEGQNCGSYSFDARKKILTEMYCSQQ